MTIRVSDAEFKEIWMRCEGHVPKIAKALESTERLIYRRRNNLEAREGIALPSSKTSITGRPKEYVTKIGHRIELSVKDGIIVVFGDAHYWPGDDSIAHQALIRFINVFQPLTIICNGDAFDGAKISRHPPTGWAKMPDVADELAFCKEKMGEIEAEAPPKAKLCWNAGNHDTRFSARLASTAPEYVRVFGTDLPDHFPAWNFAWSTFINDDIVVKHRFKGGIHAAWNNTLNGGRTVVTNHLHRSCVTPLTDYNGRRWGVDTGTLSDFGPEESKFTYGEDNPFNWGSGFGVFTIERGKLLPPELVVVQEKIPYFRGKSLFAETVKTKPTVNNPAKAQTE